MNNPEQMHQYSSTQEIDIVDLAAIFWRRKVTIILVALVSTIISLGLFYEKSTKLTISTVVLVGDSVTLDETGQIFSQQPMSAWESKHLLENAILPECAAKTAGTAVNINPATIKVAIDQMKGEVGSVIVISSTATTHSKAALTTVLDESAKSLVDLQNKIINKQTSQITSEINNLELKIELEKIEAKINEQKQPLVTKDLNNQLLIDKASDELLVENDRALLLKKLETAKSELEKQEVLLKSRKNVLQTLTTLKDTLRMRREELEQQLIKLSDSRNKMTESLHTSGNANTLITEALLAIDGRDSKFRSSINSIDVQLCSTIPKSEIEINQQINLGINEISTLKHVVILAQQAINLFDVHKSYEQRKLQETNTAIDVELVGFDASQQANIKKLEQQKSSLELKLEKSTKSKIAIEAHAKENQGVSLLIYILGGVFAGGLLGCFFALFIDLVAKAKIRITEST